jgi:hypothetical protein
VIPVPVILVEFVVAFGVALLGANALAFVRLRRDGNWPPAKAPADGPSPSAARVVGGFVVGLVVTLWALATWFTQGYHF